MEGGGSELPSLAIGGMVAHTIMYHGVLDGATRVGQKSAMLYRWMHGDLRLGWMLVL